MFGSKFGEMGRIVRAAAVLALVASPAWASFSGKPETPSPSSGSSAPEGSASDNLTPRQRADRWYGDAYDDVAKAKQSEQDSKPKDAEKKYKRAIERAQRAVQEDSTYFEAWNLIGFASRKLHDYPASLAAYQTCLRVNPEYAPAREYYGEALIETGDLKGAHEQLVWLQKLKADEQTQLLQAALASKEGAAKPDSAKAGGGSQ